MSAADALTPFNSRLRLPLIAAPMFLVSGIELVVAACRNGVVGSFPTANCRTPDELDAWLTTMRSQLDAHADSSGPAAPIAPNLIVHPSNTRLADDLAIVVRHRPEIVITSVGSPVPVLPALHDAGALVLADVASLRHAERAVAAGADGLVLLTAGAGGQTGWLNPFAFVRAVRSFFDGPVVLAGGIADGRALRAAEVLGCDLAYMGTRFIATRESMAPEAHKQMVVDSTADDVVLTSAFIGLPTSILRGSIDAAGIDAHALPARSAPDVSTDISTSPDGPTPWRDIWSAGHSASGITAIQDVADVVAETHREYVAAGGPTSSVSTASRQDFQER